MDGGILAWITGIVAICTLVIGWFFNQSQRKHRFETLKQQIRIQEEQKKMELLKIWIDSVIKLISIETDPNEKQVLRTKLKDKLEDLDKKGVKDPPVF